jgi:endonuclease/exonuclease/phosphatase family metal-dependent hydrolase
VIRSVAARQHLGIAAAALRSAKGTVLGCVVASLALAACEPLATTWDYGHREDVPVHQRSQLIPPEVAEPTALKVMAWNIKYGAGRIDFWFDLWGDRVQMTRAEVDANMAGIYALINEVDPDILMTEEIEVNSRRSAYVNMVTGILENTRLNYAAYIPTWRARYIPSEGLGRMDLGNAIFSRYPIVRAERIPQADRTDQDPLTTYFYIHRAVGRAVIAAGARDVVALVVHTEAYDQDGTKGRQLVQIGELLGAETGPFVIGGDFNALPPTSVRTSGFPDENPKSIGTAFEQPPYALDEMQPFYDAYVPAIALDRYGTTEAEQSRYYSHSVIGRDKLGTDGQPGFWNRKLDYLFVNAPAGWVAGSTDVLQLPGRGNPPIVSDPMLLSDHCPVTGAWSLPP